MNRIGLALLLACGVAAAGTPPPIGATAKLDHLVATVDRTPVWQSEIDELFARNDLTKPTPEQLKAALDLLIDQAILQHTADALHLTTSDTEIDAAVEQIKKQNSLDDAGLDKALAEQHYTRAQYREEMARQLRAQKVYQIDLVPHVTVTEDDIKHAYTEAKAIDTKMGPLDDKLRETLRSTLWNKKLGVEQEAWIQRKRAAAHIERRL